MKSPQQPKNNVIDRIRAWRLTRKGAFISAVVDLALVYAFGSWAVDSGSLWHYAIAIVLFISALVHLTNGFETYGHPKHGKQGSAGR